MHYPTHLMVTVSMTYTYHSLPVLLADDMTLLRPGLGLTILYAQTTKYYCSCRLRNWSLIIDIFIHLVLCPPLVNITNGHVLVSGLIPNSTATYSCAIGYLLNGTISRTCQENGEWSGQDPTCEGISKW